MAYKVSGEKKAEWKEKAIENQNAARELILSVSRSYVEDPDKIAEVLQFASNFYQYSLHNMQLIYAQNRFARFVQSFDAWKKMDAHVQKGENLVGKSSSGDELEIIPISSGKYIDLDPLRCYPVLKANLQAEKMVKEFVDEAKQSGFQTFGKYDFSNTEAATLGNRRRRAM